MAKKIEKTIGRTEASRSVLSQRQTNYVRALERIPGLESLVEKISESISGEWERPQGYINVD